MCQFGYQCDAAGLCAGAGSPNIGCDRQGGACFSCARGDFEYMVTVNTAQDANGAYIVDARETLGHLRPDLGGYLVDRPGIANGNSTFQVNDLIKTINGYRADLIPCWLAFETHSAEAVIVKYVRGGTTHTITIPQP